eukprot:g1316.t1
MQDHGNGVFTASCLRALDIVEPMESIVCEMEPKKLQEVGLMLKVCFAPEQTDMLSKLSSGNLVPAQLPRPSDSEFLTANSFGRHKEGYSRIQHWLGQLPKLYQKADVDLLKRLKLPAGTTWQAFCAQAPGYFQSAGKSLSNAEFGEDLPSEGLQEQVDCDELRRLRRVQDQGLPEAPFRGPTSLP